MPHQSVNHLDPDEHSRFKASGQAPGLLETAGMLEREIRKFAYDYLYLAALETRHAGESLVRIIAMGVIAACLLATAWLALVSAGVILLVQHTPMSASLALLVVFAIHCLFALILAAAIRRKSRCLLFPETISRLDPGILDGSETERPP